VLGWSVGSSAPTGARTGLAWYHLGRQAFAFHLASSLETSAQVLDICNWKGRVLFSVEGDGLYYEDVSKYVSDAWLISSVADWNNAGLKVSDRIEVAHKALPTGSSVTIDYTKKHPEENSWTTGLTSSTALSLGATDKVSNVSSRLFAVKLKSASNEDASDAPEIQSFSVRQNPTLQEKEYVLTRFIRILAEDQKDDYAEVIRQDPDEVRDRVRDLGYTWVTLYEPDATYTAFVQNVADYEPMDPVYRQTGGESARNTYVLRLDLIGTKG
ncbi:MAG: hypothetical protein AB1551_08815, partial [Actinomycetota bacterium]